MTKTALPLVIVTGVRQPRDDRRDAKSFGRLVRGDRDALADLYDAHASSLFRHGLALTRRTVEAEDLVQAVFLKLATTGAPLLAVRNPANYLHRILQAAWIDGQRRPAVARESAIDTDDDAFASNVAGDLASAIDVTRALARLPAAQREIVHLHLIEGFSFREAGRITGVSMFTAASRFRVALDRLRQSMGQR
jgi:RNA polymerase sigma factor (sigma-70 family)